MKFPAQNLQSSEFRKCFSSVAKTTGQCAKPYVQAYIKEKERTIIRMFSTGQLQEIMLACPVVFQLKFT